ncbi:MAG TPA: hypothetical protein VFU19_08795 [Iamia sp.]|nr:hypothetical protein [Iamia sp.]
MDPDDHEDDHDEDLGGDPACWLDQVCERCGAVVEDHPHDCPA